MLSYPDFEQHCKCCSLCLPRHPYGPQHLVVLKDPQGGEWREGGRRSLENTCHLAMCTKQAIFYPNCKHHVHGHRHKSLVGPLPPHALSIGHQVAFTAQGQERVMYRSDRCMHGTSGATVEVSMFIITLGGAAWAHGPKNRTL